VESEKRKIQRQLDATTASMQDLQKEYDQVSRENNSFKDRERNLRAEIAARDAKIRSQNESIVGNQNSATNLNEENSNLEKDKAKLVQQLRNVEESSTNTINNLTASTTKLQAELLNKESYIQEISVKSQKQVRSLEIENERLTLDLLSRTKQLEAANRNVTLVSFENGELKRNLNTQMANRVNLEVQLDTVKTKLQILQREGTTEEKVAIMLDEISRLKQQLGENQIEINKLQSQIKSQQSSSTISAEISTENVVVPASQVHRSSGVAPKETVQIPAEEPAKVSAEQPVEVPAEPPAAQVSVDLPSEQVVVDAGETKVEVEISTEGKSENAEIDVENNEKAEDDNPQ